MESTGQRPIGDYAGSFPILCPKTTDSEPGAARGDFWLITPVIGPGPNPSTRFMKITQARSGVVLRLVYIASIRTAPSRFFPSSTLFNQRRPPTTGSGSNQSLRTGEACY